MTAQPKCKLVRYDLLRFSFSTSEGTDVPNVGHIDPNTTKTNIQGTFARNEEQPDLYMVTLSVVFLVCARIELASKKPMLGTFEAKIQGIFRWGETLSSENAQLPYLNAAQILYGALRDRIAQFSATTFFGALFLPTVMIQDFLFPEVPDNGIAPITQARIGSSRQEHSNPDDPNTAK